MKTQASLPDIRKLSLSQLKDQISIWEEPGYRAGQIYEWIWKRSAISFDEMTNLSKVLRNRLKESYDLYPVRMDAQQLSEDGTIKTRYILYDGHLIESVLIPVKEENRYTVCVSSQVGCSLSCTFCATGRMKRHRNLEAGEIYDQVAKVNMQSEAHFQHRLTNIVYMGMGEPLLAYKPVMESIDLITSEKGLGFSPRRITVSTAGIAKMIKKLADDGAKFNLALSLHAADDEKRNEIMPINQTNNLAVLMDALKYFYLNTGNRISYEYIAFQDFNDSVEDAKRLARLCSHFPVRVNIIEYNPIDGAAFRKSSFNRLNQFARILKEKGVMVTVRRSRGRDIDAACGQLANKESL